MGFLTEGAEVVSESGRTYIAVSRPSQANMWVAVEKNNACNVVTLKEPWEDEEAGSWPKFVHKMIMHELFKESCSIQKQVDRIPPVKEKASPPILALEIFQTTLWQARTKRPLSRLEIAAIVKSILEALRDIHANGLVYGDLNMESVVVDGFVSNADSPESCLAVKLGELGSIRYPAVVTAQSIAYRAPEVLFKELVTPAADIWAVGLICSHLLEAQKHFSDTGLHEDMDSGARLTDERVQTIRDAIANDYDLRSVDFYKDCALPIRGEGHSKNDHWEDLRKRGLDELDVAFLQRLLRADPRKRPSAKAILSSQWMGLLARDYSAFGADGAADAVS